MLGTTDVTDSRRRQEFDGRSTAQAKRLGVLRFGAWVTQLVRLLAKRPPSSRKTRQLPVSATDLH